MNRRDFLKLATAGACLSNAGLSLHAAEAGYDGRLLLVLQAEGGWDISSFCDPKMNIPGEADITRWSDTDETRVVGAMPYAPYAGNEAFFERYHQDMLVINGVDTQTNSHSVGVIHSWSGRNSSGYPSLTAMFAALQAPEIPLSYLNYGGYSDTAGLIRFNRIAGVETLESVIEPNRAPWTGGGTLHTPAQMNMIQTAQKERLERLLADTSVLPVERYNASSYLQSLQTKDQLFAFAEVLPERDSFPEGIFLGPDAGTSYLKTQIALSLLAFKSGVACSGDLHLRGFDTHAKHDQFHEPLLSHLTDSLDYLWNYAEQQGVADRLTVVVSSDFSRTPYYNSVNGKDHWPIGSVLVMEKNPGWGNRVVGQTDEGQNAYKINPQTLQRDDTNGTIIYPKHIHKALRRHLGLENTFVDADFPFNNTEDFDFFNPTLST